MAFLGKLFDDDATGEHHRAARWLMIAFVIQGVVTWAACILSFPLSYIVERGWDFSRLYDKKVLEYFDFIVRTGGFGVLFSYYWWGLAYVAGKTASIIPVLPLASIPVVEVMLRGLNPYNTVWNPAEDARVAEDRIIKKMDGIITTAKEGLMIVLGTWKGKFLKLRETLSVLCFAPPGTGKSTAVVIPTIFECDTVSMIVNDPKPELCYITSGYRSRVGPVFIINWGQEDEPDKGVFYPSWNPLSPGTIPTNEAERDMYIDSMVNVFVQDPKGSTSDPHWTNTGRAALSGFLNFIVSKVEKALANDYFFGKMRDGAFTVEDAASLEEYYLDMKDSYSRGALTLLRDGKLSAKNYVAIGTWQNIPKPWIGMEPSIPMMIDWITESQINITEDVRRRKESGDQMAALADPMKEMLDACVAEASHYGYAQRSITELAQLAATPDKERGSIMSTALTGVNIFKNRAVRQRTKRSDFTFRDLRGMVDPKDGKIKPVTIYLSVNQTDARALGVITGVFVELMSNYLVSTPPNKVLDKKGTAAGPYPILFVLDEFPQMPKLQAVIDGPAMGRGMKVSYLLIAQDLAQVAIGYGNEQYIETLMSTTAIKILLTQNNDKIAARFSDAVGTMAIVGSIAKDNTAHAAFDVKEELSSSKKAAMSSAKIRGLKFDQQLVIVQGFPKNPVIAGSPRYYLDPKLLAKSKIPPAPALPPWLNRHHVEG
ncbi:MAG: type IV secretory system conjugative DNA transfer family protein [Rickettsiales bacterium]|jgi:type IV secretory pathway TraG/TraD family ATPase VirD4|nr:type IV secretory system conjugative DNA transfer family protein [Rickettsiales bacterium]